MKIGYARVSTEDQDLSLQRDALTAAGVDRIETDKKSGKNADRPGLQHALEHLRAGDTLVVWKLDRLGRSLKDLIEIINGLDARGVGFRSITEAIDTTTNGGKLIFHLFGALAEFERGLMSERTKAGLAAARARGRKGGRPSTMNGPTAQRARSLYADTNNTPAAICRELGISRATLYRYVKGVATTGSL